VWGKPRGGSSPLIRIHDLGRSVLNGCSTVDTAPPTPLNIAVTADVFDPAALHAVLASPSPEVIAAMEAHGVVQPISAYVEA
jgi:hypothetical protein